MCPLGPHLWLELVALREGALANLLHDASLYLTAGAPRTGVADAWGRAVSMCLVFTPVIYHKQVRRLFPHPGPSPVL